MWCLSFTVWLTSLSMKFLGPFMLMHICFLLISVPLVTGVGWGGLCSMPSFRSPGAFHLELHLLLCPSFLSVQKADGGWGRVWGLWQRDCDGGSQAWKWHATQLLRFLGQDSIVWPNLSAREAGKHALVGIPGWGAGGFWENPASLCYIL